MVGRRRGAALALGTAIVLALQACGSGSGGAASSTPARAGGTLDVLVGANAQYPDQQKAFLARVAAQMKAQQGTDVTFETFASPADEQKRIQTSVVSGQGPDVYSLGTTFTPVAAATGAFVRLGSKEWAAVGGRDRFAPSTLAMSGKDTNHQIGVPFASRPFAMVYNTDLFAKAGIPGPPKTWDELVADGEKLSTGGVHGAAVAYADSFDPWKFIWMFANQYGDPLVKGGRARIDDPAVEKAYAAYFGLLTDHHIVDPAAAGWTNPQALASFAAGQSAMMLMTSSGSSPTLASSPVAGHWAYAPLPAVPPGSSSLPSGGVGATTIVSGDNLAVADYSAHKAAALALVQLMTSRAVQLDYSKTFGELPTNAAAAQQVTSSNAQLAPIVAAGKGAKGTPFTGAWSDVQLSLTNVVVQTRPDLAAGAVPPAKVASLLAEAQESAQTALDRAGSQ